ncbi:AMP-binding protein [Echinimonas agarilytica]|uniref:AMP-binding protein n=1 Tax=Echinimonas agarilytica TaxID=1215918 RepID=A0AA42B9H3_9GAMM|nr:AMP-binding protein [Echinimonas agarilytica]MCM2681101.1 AMP-binding protein [Echinimonas agarilytica]
MAALSRILSELEHDSKPRLLGVEAPLGGPAISGRQWSAAATSIAQTLLTMDTQHRRFNGRIAVCSDNPYQLILMATACLKAGMTFQPISPRWPIDQRGSLMRSMQSTACWPSKAFMPSDHILHVDINIEELVAQSHTIAPQAQHVSCTTLLTSGSTGTPKAVEHSFEQHLAAAQFCNPILNLSKRSCWLMSLPIYHAAGYSIFMRCLAAGATIALQQQRSLTIEDFELHSVTHASLVTTQLKRLLELRHFNSAHLTLRHIMVGGGPVSDELVLTATERGFKVYLSYGMTETAAAIALSEVKTHAGIDVSNNRNLKLHDDEIWLRGSQIAQSYLTWSEHITLTDAQGWFATGDTGEVIDDHLFIVGRKDNQFISGGENIQPELIERALLLHPSIQNAVVVPVADSEFGARPAAYILWKESPVAIEQLKAALSKTLPRFMFPSHWFEWPALAQDQKPPRKLWAELAEQQLVALNRSSYAR